MRSMTATQVAPSCTSALAFSNASVGFSKAPTTTSSCHTSKRMVIVALPIGQPLPLDILSGRGFRQPGGSGDPHPAKIQTPRARLSSTAPLGRHERRAWGTCGLFNRSARGGEGSALTRDEILKRAAECRLWAEIAQDPEAR